MPVLSKRAPRAVAAAALITGAALVCLGFDLDRGELACEQAVGHLMECCPEVHFTRGSCIQQGGCDREGEETIVSMEESECLREMSCEAIVARDVCGRLQDRIEAVEATDGPSIQQLYVEDGLCD